MTNNSDWGGFTPLPGDSTPSPAAPPVSPPPAAPVAPPTAGPAPTGGAATAAASGRATLAKLAAMGKGSGMWGKSPLMKDKRVRLVVAILGVVAIALGVKQALSSGDDKAFYKKADELCAAAKPGLDSAAQNQNFQQAGQIQGALVNQIHALKQPSNNKAKLGQLYALLEADSQALMQGDIRSAQTIEGQLPALAAGLPFKVCLS